jgi:[ribosomal protein S5]-alanine N-acetyltransferase
MLEIKFGTFPEITTERLRLRQMNDTDASTLFQLRSDPRIMEQFDAALMTSEDEARAFMEKIHTSFAENKGVQWSIEPLDGGPMIGTICIWRIDTANHRGEVGYLLHPDFQRKGIMSEALQAVLDYGFQTLHLHSFEANVNPKNTASSQLLRSRGFVQEAHFRENYYFNGIFHDSLIFSLLTPLR